MGPELPPRWWHRPRRAAPPADGGRQPNGRCETGVGCTAGLPGPVESAAARLRYPSTIRALPTWTPTPPSAFAFSTPSTASPSSRAAARVGGGLTLVLGHAESRSRAGV